jgi:hypothetical protein
MCNGIREFYAKAKQKAREAGLFGKRQRLLVLRVVLLTIDVAALHILGVTDASALLIGHDAIGLGVRFHGLHMRLAAFEASGFARRQFPGLLALFDTILLARFTSVDPGCRLSESGNGDKGDKRGGDEMSLHDVIPPEWLCGSATRPD